MKHTITFAVAIAFAAALFVVRVPSADAACWLDVGPAWMNCNVQDNNDNDDNNNDSDNDDLSVSTLSASNVDEDSATLRGEITDIDSDEDYERYFEWGTDEDDLDETLSVSGTTDDEGSFSRTLSGLSDDREYFYRACAENTDNGSDDDCGSIRSFTTDEEDNDSNNDDDDNDNDSDNGDNAVITTDASAIGYSTAILNGVVVNNDGSQTVWFEWGRTTSLGNRTSSRAVSNDQAMVSVDVSGLSSGTTYFFRLVSGDGEIGDLKAFTTRSSGGTAPTTPTTPTTPSTPSTTISTDQYLNVDLVSNAKDVRSGQTVMYQAVYQNLTTKTLQNITVIVDFPEGVTIVNAEKGMIVGQRIEYTLGSLSPKATESFAIETTVSSKTGEKFLVGIIEATYDHPTQDNTRINVVDYGIVKVMRGAAVSGSRDDQKGTALFAGTFFPKGLGGWLILMLAIVLLIVLSRKLYKQKEEEKKKEEAAKPGLKIAK